MKPEKSSYGRSRTVSDGEPIVEIFNHVNDGTQSHQRTVDQEPPGWFLEFVGVLDDRLRAIESALCQHDDSTSPHEKRHGMDHSTTSDGKHPIRTLRDINLRNRVRLPTQ